MKIGILCHSNFGGSARIATELASELASRDHRVHLFSRNTPVAGWGQTGDVVLHTTVADGSHDPFPHRLRTNWPTHELAALTEQVLHTIRSDGLDLVHFHHAIPFASVTAQIRRVLGDAAPLLIGTLHGTDVSVHGRDPRQTKNVSTALAELDALTTVSLAHARLANQVLDLRTVPTVIPNFVDLLRFRGEPKAPHAHYEWWDRSHSPDRGRPHRIIHLSNLRPVKDPHAMATIFVGIHRRLAAELWLIGDGDGMRQTREIFEREGVENQVRYWGLRHDVDDLLPFGDLLLVTSHSESFCLAALEAMASGVPVLARDVGGLAEVVVDRKTGALFPRDDLCAAIELAVGMLQDGPRMESMRRASLRRATQFDRRRVVSLYEDFYRALMARTGRVGTVARHASSAQPSSFSAERLSDGLL